MFFFCIPIFRYGLRALKISILVFVLFVDFQPAVAGSMVGVRLGLSEHIQDTNAIFSLALDEEDVNSIQEVSKKGKDLLRVIGDCGDEYRR